jgi:hypothetical protein
MSTTIVRIYTPEGFVIAADGRNYNPETKTKVSDSVRKIFLIEESARRLVYSITGTCELTPKESSEVAFDVLARIHNAIAEFAGQNFRSLWRYADALSKSIIDWPEQATQAIIGDEPPTIVFFDGYYDGRPKRAHIKLLYDGQPPVVSIDELKPGHPLGVGSERVLQSILEPNGALARYRTPAIDVNPDERTLPDAIAVARTWMSARCCGPEAENIDPGCVSMGGQILMSTLTVSDGFRWIPYEPL